MSNLNQSDSVLVRRIQEGHAEAWSELIARYEGRLLAFAESRTHDRSAAEDIVQETFLGFLTSLPNYDRRRSLEGYLFSIAAHKLTDYLRRQHRRPELSLAAAEAEQSDWEPQSPQRPASTIARSRERRKLEEESVATALGELIEHWRTTDQWTKLCCAELLFVRGWANKEVAARLGISEQTVANYKFEFIAKMRGAIRKLGVPEDVFPELYQQI